MSRTPLELNRRERATLLAAAAGRIEMTCNGEPALVVDGVCLCDQATAHGFVHAGLLAPRTAGQLGARVMAVLTDAGRVALRNAV